MAICRKPPKRRYSKECDTIPEGDPHSPHPKTPKTRLTVGKTYEPFSALPTTLLIRRPLNPPKHPFHTPDLTSPVGFPYVARPDAAVGPIYHEYCRRKAAKVRRHPAR